MKRILSLEGGGIRGVFSIAILERIEALLRERHTKENPGLVLADYFDFIGGTSTGAIIAALLSKGLSVRAIRENYERLGPIVFRRKPFWQSWRSFYSSEEFAELLKELFEESPGKPMDLGSSKLLTHLMLVLRNGSTGSVWPLTNEPNAKYNRRDDPEKHSNLDLPLWQLVRASAAAPVFFPSELIGLRNQNGDEKFYEFIDGGVSPYNNPSMAMFLHATLPAYQMNYPRGRDELFICSVGTGVLPLRFDPGQLGQINLIGGALRTLKAMMESVTKEQDKICRAIGDCVYGDPIDRELGDMKGVGLGQFQYVRYQHEFTKEEIKESRRVVRRGRPFDIDDLAGTGCMLRLGREYADSSVAPEHFPE